MKFYYALILFSIFFFCKPAFSPIEKGLTQTQNDANCNANSYKYTWIANSDENTSICENIVPPEGFERIKLEQGSFADWLRYVPLLLNEKEVHLYNGNLKGNQNAHYAIIDLDVGKEDLQQCADAVMRLRAEYLFATNQKDNIVFNFTSGDACKYSDWKNGIRPKFSGNSVSFVQSKSPDDSYKNFKEYMTMVFRFCGTASLSKELKAKSNIADIVPGDVFIRGGFPGHAVIVMDVAQSLNSDERIFLLAQSYMPAQQMHILNNLENSKLSPWYSVNFANQLITPEWIFVKNEFMQF